jgi:hypothetical protein
MAAPSAKPDANNGTQVCMPAVRSTVGNPELAYSKVEEGRRKMLSNSPSITQRKHNRLRDLDDGYDALRRCTHQSLEKYPDSLQSRAHFLG